MGGQLHKNVELWVAFAVQSGSDSAVNSRLNKKVVGIIADKLKRGFHETNKRIRVEWKVLKARIHLNDY